VEFPLLQIIAVVYVMAFFVHVHQGDYHSAMTDTIIAVLAGIYAISIIIDRRGK
jgi:hypothetical protein